MDGSSRHRPISTSRSCRWIVAECVWTYTIRQRRSIVNAILWPQLLSGVLVVGRWAPKNHQPEGLAPRRFMGARQRCCRNRLRIPRCRAHLFLHARSRLLGIVTPRAACIRHKPPPQWWPTYCSTWKNLGLTMILYMVSSMVANVFSHG
jgi:hypothetical protein